MADKPKPRVVESWAFNGTEASIADALAKYPELKFVWRGGGESFASWKCGNRFIPLRQGKYIVRLSDGTFSRRTVATLRRIGMMPKAPSSPVAPPAAPAMTKAWVFDGTEASVAEALATHRELKFVVHAEGNYLLWSRGAFRYRVRAGQCLVELAGGGLAHRQIRAAREAGLVP